MAREFTKVKLGIWAEDEMRALPPPSQHLRLVLQTSSSLSYCGVADWRPHRIAGLAAGWTPEEVQAAAGPLIDQLVVLVDESTEEALLRTWIRDDDLMKQPKLATAMASAHAAVASQVLRGVIVHELRLLHQECPELKGWGSPPAVAVLAKASVDPSTYPLGNPWTKGSGYPSGWGSSYPSVNGSGNPSGNPTVLGNPKGSGKGSGRASVKGGPTTTTTTTTSNDNDSDSLRSSGAAAPREVTAQTVTATWVEACREGTGTEPSRSMIGQVARQAKELLAGNPAELVLDAARSAGAGGFASIDRELTARAGRRQKPAYSPAWAELPIDPKTGRPVAIG